MAGVREQAARRTRIGLLGGSFNPVHLGHVQAADIFTEALGLDMVLVIPSSYPFYKLTALTDYRDRMAMCLLAFEGKQVVVSDMEKERPGGMLTCDVVSHARVQYPAAELFLLVGDDVMAKMPKWMGIETIIQESRIGVLSRSGFLHRHAELERMGARIDVIMEETLPYSSSMVRSAIADGNPIASMVPGAVAEYIRLHGLYRIVTM